MDDDQIDLNAERDNSLDGRRDDGNENPPERNENEEPFDGELGVGVPVPDAVPTKKRSRTVNTLNVQKLKGPRGVHTLEKYFTNVKFKGKGREHQDLDMVMKNIEHWAHRLYPKYSFDDSLAAFERLGKKKELHNHMHRYRMNLLEPEDDLAERLDNNKDDDDGEQLAYPMDEPIDEFDQLLNEQIAISKNLSRSTHNMHITGVEPMDDSAVFGSQSSQPIPVAASPPPLPPVEALDDEVRARIAENKRKALERLQARRSMVGNTSEDL